MGQAEHLHEIRHRRLAAVGLPVGIGDEADGSVEREVLGNRALSCGIERQRSLQPHQRIKKQKAGDVEQQHRDRVGSRVLFAALVNPRDSVYQALDRPQHRRKYGGFAAEHARHIRAERRRDRNDDRAIQQDLHPACDCHGGVISSELFGFDECVDEINQQRGGNEARECVIKNHRMDHGWVLTARRRRTHTRSRQRRRRSRWRA